MGKKEADEIVQEIKDLLIENGCTVSERAIYDLAIYVVRREQAAINKFMGSIKNV